MTLLPNQTQNHPGSPVNLRRATTRRDWIPDQPGAWAMAMLPALAGMIVGGTNGTTIWLLIAWILCYCVQFTAARWLASRFARRYAPPVLIYSVLLAAVGIPFVIVNPSILWWAPLFLVLAAASFAAAWLRRERTLWGNTVSITAACAMVLVMNSVSARSIDATYPALANGGLPVAIMFVLTQFGSVLFVKTMIRERGRRGYRWASWIWHSALLLISLALWALTGFERLFIMLLLTCVWLLARSIALPLVARTRRLKPVVVGIVEMVSSLLVFAAAIATF
ncbi:YwiC-like protein [Bifidobacterium goeldii]|uniref:YwiC-like protein n=1 Tax=Bifidobacterium goeldii TaxID=2306975 RepID=A0A430FJD5_9BIFI|nr:YwiC-like family protein [Bifidobacterium goeldii]RSX52871.1 YwiC-like protein [Bifidobacterium goeldii]